METPSRIPAKAVPIFGGRESKTANIISAGIFSGACPRDSPK